ncbi:hypothetical protein FOZ62_018793 [Perkinsus olseni]|uniref:Uncharacterized protein n=1 Tax=Perkinsus olseni TaxID=32597 RepID=A0A7J6SS55_PEROL|nr:hypothetical protein FOZ62_018793 [Perkinsus olseni]
MLITRLWLYCVALLKRSWQSYAMMSTVSGSKGPLTIVQSYRSPDREDHSYAKRTLASHGSRFRRVAGKQPGGRRRRPLLPEDKVENRRTPLGVGRVENEQNGSGCRMGTIAAPEITDKGSDRAPFASRVIQSQSNSAGGLHLTSHLAQAIRTGHEPRHEDRKHPHNRPTVVTHGKVPGAIANFPPPGFYINSTFGNTGSGAARTFGTLRHKAVPLRKQQNFDGTSMWIGAIELGAPAFGRKCEARGAHLTEAPGNALRAERIDGSYDTEHGRDILATAVAIAGISGEDTDEEGKYNNILPGDAVHATTIDATSSDQRALPGRLRSLHPAVTSLRQPMDVPPREAVVINAATKVAGGIRDGSSGTAVRGGERQRESVDAQGSAHADEMRINKVSSGIGEEVGSSIEHWTALIDRWNAEKNGPQELGSERDHRDRSRLVNKNEVTPKAGRVEDISEKRSSIRRGADGTTYVASAASAGCCDKDGQRLGEDKDSPDAIRVIFVLSRST